jgi:transcription elongation factor GreA
MIEALKEKLSGEVAKLRHELTVTLPKEIKKAVDHGDLRENSEYKAALERQRFVQARLGQLVKRLSKLSDIDITQIPTDRVGLGSRVTVEDQVSEEREVYELVFGDGGDVIDGQVSMSSPIGLALQNKSVGDLAILKLPSRTRRLRIVELLTFHQIVIEE